MAWTLSGRAIGQLRPIGGDTLTDFRSFLKAKSPEPLSPRLWSALAVALFAIAMSLKRPLVGADSIDSPWLYISATMALDSAYAYAPWLAMCASASTFAFVSSWGTPTSHGRQAAPGASQDAAGPSATMERQVSEGHPTTAVATREATFVGLVAQISHDLRTPLNAIIGFSDIMQRELLGPLGSNRYSDYAEHIRMSGYSLLKSVEDTLAMTRLLVDRADGAVRQHDVQSINLSELVDDACALIGSEARRRGVSIEITSPVDGVVQGHPEALRQALVNILTSSLGASAEHGCIAIDSAVVRQCAHLSIRFPMSKGADAGSLTAGLPWKIAGLLIELQAGTITHDQGLDHSRVDLMLPMANADPS